MRNLNRMSVGELAAYIASHLRDAGIHVVLSGGSCVAIYSNGKYVSKDLDFIDTGFATRREIAAAMSELGFSRENRYFVHRETDYLVEFPSGPPAIGHERIGAIHELTFRTGTLRILSPTDCVKDRLAAFYHWGDLQCLDQAILVAQSHDVDMHEVKRWSKAEDKASAFADIVSRFPYRG